MKHTCRSNNKWILHSNKDKVFLDNSSNITTPHQVNTTMRKRKVTLCLVAVSKDFRLNKAFHKSLNKHYMEINHSVTKYTKDRLHH